MCFLIQGNSKYMSEASLSVLADGLAKQKFLKKLSLDCEL